MTAGNDVAARQPATPARRLRRGRRVGAAAIAGLLLLGVCSDDAGIDGDAPDGDGEAPRVSDPESQDAPNVEDPDLSGDETPDIEAPATDGETSGED